MRLMRVNAVSAIARTIETRNSSDDRGEDRPVGSAHVASRSRRVGHGTWQWTGAQRSVPLLELAEAGEQLALSPLHRRMLTRIGMVIVEQMQDTVDDEQRDLVVGGPSVLGRLARRDLRADRPRRR